MDNAQGKKPVTTKWVNFTDIITSGEKNTKV